MKINKVPFTPAEKGFYVSGRQLEKLAQEAGDATQNAEAAAAERIEDRVAELDARVFRAIARRREASIEAGRAFRELKKILGHGKWQKHFAETFVPHGISLRTAQRWMRRARKADKHDKLSFFKSAMDRGAQDIKDAGQQAETVVETAKVKMTALYRLPLRLTDEEKAAVDALRKLAEWSQMEKEIVCVLQRLCRQHLNKNVRRPS